MKRLWIFAAVVGVASGLTWSQTVIRQQFGDMTAAKLASIPKLVLPAMYGNRILHPLPASVDNTKQKYMPNYLDWGIDGWSCANAAAISYCYTYEEQLAQNLASSGNDPRYDYEYTYHFLNSGNEATGGDGWMFVEAFDIVKQTGAPTVADFEGGSISSSNNIQGWMGGYPKYYSAMKLRASEYYQVDASIPANDTIIKQYLYDHADGSAAGGILTFQMNSDDIDNHLSTVSGKSVITSMGTGGGHALTIAGYDDTFNGGSFELVNSWGDDGTAGCPSCIFWAKYSLFAAGGGLATSQGTPVMCVNVKKNYLPQLALKISITESQRNKIAIMTGVANSTTATTPTQTKDYQGAFNYAGGSYPMAGIGQSSTLEIGLDLTDLTPNLGTTGGTFFLQVVAKGGTGQINSVALEDYTSGTVKETIASVTNKAINANGTTLVAIPWTGTVSAINEALSASSELNGECVASPNPALRDGGAVRIAFAGAGATSAKLRISDINGRTVYNSTMKLNALSSSFAFPWELKNSRGARVNPGLYYASVALRTDKGMVKMVATKIRVI